MHLTNQFIHNRLQLWIYKNAQAKKISYISSPIILVELPYAVTNAKKDAVVGSLSDNKY